MSNTSTSNDMSTTIVPTLFKQRIKVERRQVQEASERFGGRKPTTFTWTITADA